MYTATVSSLAVALVLTTVAWCTLGDKLQKFPGPTIASWTDLWQLWDVYVNQNGAPAQRLHAKYGSIVRIAPNKLSFASPAAVSDLYLGKPLQKSHWYTCLAAVFRGKIRRNLFASDDIGYHKEQKQIIARSFKRGPYQERISSLVDELIHRLREQYADVEGAKLEPYDWFHYFTSDVSSAVLLGRPLGFLEKGSDIQEILNVLEFATMYHGYVGYAPWLDKLLLKNPVLLWIARLYPRLEMKIALVDLLLESKRNAENATGEEPTMVSSWISEAHAKGRPMDEGDIISLGIGTFLAAKDPAAAFFTAFFYLMGKHSQIYSTLRAEILSNQTGAVGRYLQACIQETLRFFPISRFHLERVTPAEGMVIDKQFVPGKTVVCMNAWAVQHNREVFGDDADQFRPERWLDDNGREQMHKAMLAFGAGVYACPGKDIMWLMAEQLIPAFFKAFEFRLDDPSQPWVLRGEEFVIPSGFAIHLKKTA